MFTSFLYLRSQRTSFSISYAVGIFLISNNSIELD